MKKPTEQEWRRELITFYEGLLIGAGPFTSIVLNEAIRKLKESDLHPKRVEKWFVNLEKAWRTV